MKIKVSDYIADFFANHGISHIFTVVGGGAMHMNDSFGHHAKIRCIYNHHEQASAMSAEAYYRINNKMAGLCVTSGPGAINALNGVAGAYQDSIPMIVVSGQCKSTLTVRKNKLKLRTLGPQEFDIVSALDNFVKYSYCLMKAEDIRYCLEKAFFIALNGRPGPCWLDIPLDIQGTYIETENLIGYTPDEECIFHQKKLSFETSIVIDKIKKAERPVIYAGNGIRISGGAESLRKLIDKIRVPVVTCWNSIDLIETDSPYYVGRGGTMGDRAGNFAVQNCDLLLVIGSRLNTYQVGYQPETWAREAFVIYVDIDSDELLKPTIRTDMPICSDAKIFIDELIKYSDNITSDRHIQWIEKCKNWKKKYPVVNDRQKSQTTPVNIYSFMDEISKKLPDNSITVVSNGSASVVGSQTYYIGRGYRFIMNCGISSMGYELPAAIGACIASDKKPIICIAGDGSIQMNLQELQTIVTNMLPIKIVIINNAGYHQIRITQTNLFNKNFVGIGPDSNDLGFPDFKKLAYAYGIPYKRCDNKENISDSIQWLIDENGFCMLEVQCDTEQFFEPKSMAKKLDDGSLYSPPLEDMAPFLKREELEENMVIPVWNERK